MRGLQKKHGSPIESPIESLIESPMYQVTVRSSCLFHSSHFICIYFYFMFKISFLFALLCISSLSAKDISLSSEWMIERFFEKALHLQRDGDTGSGGIKCAGCTMGKNELVKEKVEEATSRRDCMPDCLSRGRKRLYWRFYRNS
jgi:hypothetical protein